MASSTSPGPDHDPLPPGLTRHTVVVWQNERWIPIAGWKPSWLINERPAFSSKESVCAKSVETRDYDSSDGLPSAAWVWEDSWKPFVNTTGERDPDPKRLTDDEGWQYSTNWTTDDNYVKSSSSTSAVRRRRWLRTRIELPRQPSQEGCLLCCDAPPEMCFVPCGHVACCVRCASKLSDCPICRTTVEKAIRIFHCT
eukprot:Rmarinus@m.5561